MSDRFDSSDIKHIADLDLFAQEVTVQELIDAKANLLLHLTQSVDIATRMLGEAAGGKSVFSEENMSYKAALALLKVVPVLLKALPDPKPQVSEDKDEDEDEEMDEETRLHPKPNYPRIPICPFCKAGPAAHWPIECGQNPDPERWRYNAPLDHEWPEIRELQRIKRERELKEEQQRCATKNDEVGTMNDESEGCTHVPSS